MGTFAMLFHKAGAGIPDEKMEEFKERIEKLFQMGGMMEIEQVQLCGKKAVTIKKLLCMITEWISIITILKMIAGKMRGLV